MLSGKQNHLFFGDTVEHCCRVTLYSGQTFFIPSGWIHAVFTPEDSLVFGGNFLFSCAMESQIKIYQLENTTKVPIKFRYPFFNELHWYVLSNYLECLTGRCYLTTSNDGQALIEKAVNQPEDKKEHYTQSKWNLKEKDVYLEEYELNGLKVLFRYLSKLPKSKQCLPSLITNSIALMNDAKQLIANIKQYEKSERLKSSPLACRPVLYWLCKINYEYYLQKSESSISLTSTSLTSPLKSWGAGLQDLQDAKFVAYKNKLNLETDNSNDSNLMPRTAIIASSTKSSATEIPNSFEKLIAATDISSSKKQAVTSTASTITNQLISASPNFNLSSALNSSANTVNNVYLTTTGPNNSSIRHPSSSLHQQSNLLPATNMNIYQNNSNLIMNRPMFNTPIVTSNAMSGLQSIQPGIIYTNSTATNLQPMFNTSHIQPGMQLDSMGIRNFSNYNLISNTPTMLSNLNSLSTTPTGLSVLATTSDLPVMNNLTGKFESQSSINNKNKFASSWFQPTSIQQQQHVIPLSLQSICTTTTNTKQSNLTTTSIGSTLPLSSNKSSKSNSKQSSKQQPQHQQIAQSNFASTSLSQPLTSSINQHHHHQSTGSIIPQHHHHHQQIPYNPNATNLTLTTSTPQQHPFLSTFPTAANKTPVNNMFNLTDPNRPNSVINFTGQPTSFITPTLNTNLAHPLNQNFIITPVTSNLIGNNLAAIQNPIYPNFIGNTAGLIQASAAGNMNMLAVNAANLNSALGSVQTATSIQQATNLQPIVIGKPTIKLQRINCRKCIPCNRNSCGLCSPCLAYYSKFGTMPPANNLAFSGGQTSSEICLAKKCLNPILPYAAVCCACGKNGWHNLVINPSDQNQIMQLESKCNLLECSVCFQIIHLDCVRAHLPASQKSIEGRMNNHLSNSWTCPVCIPIKDREASSKLDSSFNINKNKQITNSSTQQQPHRESINDQQQRNSNLHNLNAIRNETVNFDKSDKFKRQLDQQTANKYTTKDQASNKSLNVKSAATTSLSSSRGIASSNAKNYSSNDQSTRNRKEVYDFDDADELETDEQQQSTKFANKFKKLEQVCLDSLIQK